MPSPMKKMERDFGEGRRMKVLCERDYEYIYWKKQNK